MKTNTKTILLFIMSFALIAIIGVSYAYFSASIVQNDVKDQVVETGTLSLRYVDGAEVVMQNIKPGQTITKTVYVANTGTLDATYNLIWQELTNEITNDEMLIEGTCTRMNGTTEEVDGTCEGIDSSIISSNTIKNKVTIEPNIVHKYDLVITFKDTNDDQNYNQNKKFSGVLGVNEYQPTQFEKDSWETIATNVRNGNISNYNIGDTKEVDLGNLGKYYVRIANTTTPSECATEGFSQTACGFVLEFESIINNKQMNGSFTNSGGWPASDLRSYLNSDLYNMLPTDLKSAIIDTTVVSSHGSDDSENFVSTDRLYLLAPKEIYSDWSNSYDSAKDLTRQLDYYNNKNVSTSSYADVIKKIKTYNHVQSWWLRSTVSDSDNKFYYVSYNGYWYTYNSTYNWGVSPAFRIG